MWVSVGFERGAGKAESLQGGRSYMKVKSRFGAPAAVLCALVMLTTVFSATVMAASQTNPTIWTEWGDYHQGATVNIYGAGFGSDVQITVVVTDPDNSAVTITTMSNGDGQFSCSYVLASDAPVGQYTLTATDGIQSASDTFMDASDFWVQSANDGLGSSQPDGIPDGTSANPAIQWVTGDIGPSKEALTEGNFPPTYPPAVPGHVDYKMLLPGMAKGTYSWTIQYEFTKGGKVAFDFLTTSYGLTDHDSILYNDQSGSDLTAVTALVNGPVSTYKFSDDPFSLPSNLGGGNVAGREAAHGAAFAGNILSNPIRSLRMYGATISSISAPTHTGDVTGDSYCYVVVSFTVPSSNDGGFVLATWGGHIAIGRSGAEGYGVGNGATGISGSPYHMIFGGITGPTPVPAGKHDLSLKCTAVVVGSISGSKFWDQNDNRVWDKGEPGLAGWTISLSGGPITVPSTTTASDGSYSFANLPSGTYTVTETPQSGWTQTFPASPGTWTVSVTAESLDNAGIDFGNAYTPSVSTLLSSTSINLGGSVTDTATVTGVLGVVPIGTVQFYEEMKGDASWTALGTPVTLDSAGKATSISFKPLADGTYYFYAAYAPLATGNNYLAAQSGATDEPLTVNAVQPTVTTLLSSGSIVLGNSITDQVTVTGVATFVKPSGTVDFSVSTDGGSTWTVFSANVPLNQATGLATSGSYTPAIVGTYYFRALYSGDANYLSQMSTNEEKLGVTPYSPTVTTLLSDKTIELGKSVTDTATVNGLANPLMTGSVEFYFSTDGSATWALTPFDTKPLNVVGAVGTATSAAYTPDKGSSPTISWMFKAVYLGDSNYKSAASGATDEPLTVLNPIISVTKVAVEPEVELGQTIHYKIVASNTGNCPLSNVYVTDPNTGLSVGPINLAVGASTEILTPTWTPIKTDIDSNGNVVNTVTATGTDALSTTVSGTASATVAVLDPHITIVKTASPTVIHSGDSVTYTFVVTNTGNCELKGITVKDDKLGDLTALFKAANGGSDTLAYGAAPVTFTKTVDHVYASVTNTATAAGTDDLGKSVSAQDDATVTALPESAVTDTEFRYFDVDPMAGQQFRLIFTPYSGYKLSASNPGQFYYNVFYTGDSGDSVTLTIRIPSQFVTQGAQPIHAYSASNPYLIWDPYTNAFDWQCYVPSGELSGITISGPDASTYPGYTTYTVSGTVPSTGLFYVTVHVDYGAKSLSGFVKSGANALGTSTIPTILDQTWYEFSWSNDPTQGFWEPKIQNLNVFKKDPGIAGLVSASDGTGIANARVDISGQGITTTYAYTDQDGWYVFEFKYTGKPVTVTLKVTLPDKYGIKPIVQTVIIKSNSMVIVGFDTKATTLTVPSVAGTQGGFALAELAGMAILILSSLVGLALGPITSRVEGKGRGARGQSDRARTKASSGRESARRLSLPLAVGLQHQT